MMSVFARISSAAREGVRRFVRFGRGFGWWKISLAGGLVLGVLITLLSQGGEEKPPEIERGPRQVDMRTVGELSLSGAPLPVVGIVGSQSEAEVRTESSGQVVRVYRGLGDSVRAGEIVAEMENARERAALLQAEGAYEAAKAALAKVTRGARDEQLAILRATFESAESSLATGKTSAVNTLLSAYATADEAIRRKADQVFSNPDTSAPKFLVTSTDSQLPTDLESERVRIGVFLKRQDAASSALSAADDLRAELLRTEEEVRTIKNFLDKLVAALNKAVSTPSISETTIATYRTDANAARTSINTSLSAISSAREALANRETALEVARKNLEQGVTGGQAEDVASAEAAVKQALGSLAAARASLEKTIIRSPIAGTINLLSIERGDFVSSLTPVMTVANNKTLEITAYVTERDARELAVGGEVAIERGGRGVITRIAPALDPVTKKIEVRVAIQDGNTLLNGEAVTVHLSRSAQRTSETRMVVPLSALKIGVSSVVVFSVDDASRLVPHSVVLGELLGDSVVIEEGVGPELSIVLDARGLKAGEVVSVEQ